jgi:hypothetical protein
VQLRDPPGPVRSAVGLPTPVVSKLSLDSV